MKKFYLIWLLTILLVGSQIVMADVVTTKRRIQTPPQQTQEQQRAPRKVTPAAGGPGVVQEHAPLKNKETKLTKSVKSCRPYSETLDTTISGVDFNFKIAIKGWQNNNCRVDFVAKSTGLNDIFSTLHGDPSNAIITTFEPNIRCEFTKQQLLRVGDSILQEEERAQSGASRMLKNPALIDIKSASQLTGSDAALVDVILNEGACNILNAPDSNAMFDALFNY